MYPLAHILERARVLFPDRTAVIDGSLRMNFATLAHRVHHLAGALRGLGLERGDRVALLDWNSHRYLECYYACAHAGLAFMPLNSRLAPRELHYVLEDSAARVLMFSEPFLPQYEEIGRAATSLEYAIGLALPTAMDGVLDYETLVDRPTPLRVPVTTALEETMLIYYTSGTTGEPKGVCLTNGNMVAGAIDPLMFLGIRRDDILLHAGPLFHLATSWGVWSMPYVGAAQITHHFDPTRVIGLIARERVTMTALPGAILSMVAELPETREHDISSLRTIIYGGSPTPLGILKRAAEALPPALTHVYGITELAGYVTTLLPEEHEFEGSPDVLRRTASAGQAVPLVDVRVVDDDGRDVLTGEVGEIVCGGPKVMAGYWRKPEASAAALKGGWYHTGDMGTLDERRYLSVVDRKKDMIITGGENVYSVEVESVLSTHPDVLEVAVIGVPDEKWGEAVTAIIVARPGATPTAETLAAFCRGKIAGYKIPKAIELRADPLPKTGPGKIAKRALREPYWTRLNRRI